MGFGQSYFMALTEGGGRGGRSNLGEEGAGKEGRWTGQLPLTHTHSGASQFEPVFVS